MFGLNALVELIKSISKVVVISGMAYFALMFYKDEALHLDQEQFPLNIYHALGMIEWAFLLLTLAMFFDLCVIISKYTAHISSVLFLL